MARVLVIDDNAAVRQMLMRMLEAAGHEVFDAADGESGLTLCQRVRPRLVITDMMLPGKHGTEIIATLRREHPDLMILAITGGPDSPEGLRQGANAAVLKPFRRTQIMEVVTSLLGP